MGMTMPRPAPDPVALDPHQTRICAHGYCASYFRRWGEHGEPHWMVQDEDTGRVVARYRAAEIGAGGPIWRYLDQCEEARQAVQR